MMEYKKEFDVHTFEFWSGAKKRVNKLNYEQREKLAEWLECMFEGFGIPSETDINDVVWFEWDMFESWLNGDEEWYDAC